jgi:hypothetical protein
MSNDRQYSIGTMTGTVVDSAAKHIRQCKVNTDLMGVWSSCTPQELHQNRYKYITHKDDLVLNVTQKIGRALSNKVDVYPSVVSTFADIDLNAQCAMMYLYDSARPLDFLQKVAAIAGTDMARRDTLDADIAAWAGPKIVNPGFDVSVPIVKTKFDSFIARMPYLQAQGYAQTVGYASAVSGDTVLSVLIGGIVTVRNGHFPMRCGQAVQWYFNFEKDSFSSQHGAAGVAEWDIGSRIEVPVAGAEPLPLTDRRGKMEGHPLRTLFALPKPYVISSRTGDELYGDKIRIFARCIGGGGAHEMVDLQLMTQSL